MDLHDYIQNNQDFWQDVEKKGFIQAMNEWFLTDDTFAALAVEHIEKMSGEPKDNWDEYPKSYVEGYLYDPDSKVDEDDSKVDEDDSKVDEDDSKDDDDDSKDDDDFNPYEIELPF